MGGGAEGCRKDPLQSFVPQLVSYPRNSPPPYCPHPPAREAGKYGLSTDRVAAPYKISVSVGKKKDRMADA